MTISYPNHNLNTVADISDDKSFGPTMTSMQPQIYNLFRENVDQLLIIVSDFHIGEGFIQQKRLFSRNENFFYDDAFYGFIKYLNRLRLEKHKPVTLILNGDFLDFIRIRSLPGDREHKLIRRYLIKLGHEIRDGESIYDEQESNFGLNSHELKSVWKLQKIAEGHPEVFQALAEFVVAGNQLIVIKGNHDLEFYWPRVQKEFRKILARKLPSVNGSYRHAVERMDFIEKNVVFVQNAVIVDHTIYIEHGHQYMPITRVEGEPERDGELSLPPGSILNRYLINAIESIIPFVNNIRPASEIFRTLNLKQKFQVLRIIFRHLPTTSKIMYRHYRRDGLVLLLEILPYLFTAAYVILGFFLPMLWPDYADLYYSLTGKVGRYLVSHWFAHLLLIVASFYGTRWLFRFFGRTHHFDLKAALQTAREATRSAPVSRPKFLVIGHTHKPEIRKLDDTWWYLNPGTWIPILDRKEFYLHEKLTMSYIHFEKNERGEWDFELMQWNDARGRGQRLILLD